MIGGRAADMPLISRFLLILMAAVLLGLMVSFARQVTISHHQGQELGRLEDDTARANEELKRLQDYLEEVQSESFLQFWGRRNGWVKPGEAYVVLVGDTSVPLPDAGMTVKNGTGPDSTRQSWWRLFFGSQ